MKYTKKFQKGGKTPQEIMEEARRNQALEREAKRVDRAMQADPAREQAVATANIATPRYLNTPIVNIPQISNRFNTEIKTSNQTFDQAFATARKAGLKEFEWFNPKTNRVEKFTTELEDTPQTTPDVSQERDDITYQSQVELPEVVVTASPMGTSIIPAPQWGTYGQFPSTAPRSTAEEVSGAANTNTATSTNNSATQSSSNWWESFNENNAKRRERARNRSSRGIPEVLQRVGYVTNKLSMRYQQGGKVEDKPLYLRNIWEKVFGITPDYTPVNSQESITSYMDNTRKGPVEKRVIRKEVPYANLHSTMSIRNPGTNRADTTFTAPSGTTYNMNDVRSGKAPSGYSYKFFEKPVGYFQQGGTINNEESGSTDQLYVDFAIRYLKAKGVSEDDMVDNEGGLKDEFLEEVSTAINEVDSPDFWEQYQSNPDALVQSYIESKMEPEQIEMARKGAKLKKLKKGGMKSRKCKCGCNLTMKKEAGGTIVEVCACGCKNK